MCFQEKVELMSCFIVLGYLDPGSSSALIGTLIAALAAILFSFKDFFYKLIRGGNTQSENNDESLIIFSEGKNYWNTFKPIIDELIENKISFRYVTLDLYDPALQMESPYMKAKLYDKNSTGSFVKLEKLKAPVMLSTTPNIGCAGYPLKKPENVRCLIHVFHAYAGVSHYRHGSLDYYDAVITIAEHQNENIRHIEKLRNTPKKEIVPLGLPYLDDLVEKAGQIQVIKKDNSEKLKVLVASSWGTKSCLREYGADFIKELAKANLNVIVRPHPQSMISEPEFIEKCIKDTKKFSNVVWDFEPVGHKAMAESDIMVSDTSSIRFDYAFVYQKPVITLEIPKANQEEFEVINFDKVWIDDAAKDIGFLLDHSSVGKLVKKVKSTIDKFSDMNMVTYREEKVINFGQSAAPIVAYLKEKI